MNIQPPQTLSSNPLLPITAARKNITATTENENAGSGLVQWWVTSTNLIDAGPG